MPINFVGEPFCVSKEFCYRKLSSKGGGSFTVLSKTLCHTVPKYFVGEHFGVSESFRYQKIYASHRRVSPFSVKNFVSHRAKKIRWGAFRCFRKFRVSQKFMHKKGISLNSVEKNCLTVPIKSYRNPSVFRKVSGIDKFLAKEGEASGFCQNFFYLTGPKKAFQGTILCHRKLLVGKNLLRVRGGGESRFSEEKFLSDCTKIFQRRTVWCFRKILSSKNISHRRGGHHGFVEIFRSRGPKRKSL